MRQNDLLCAQSPVGAEPVNTVQIGGTRESLRDLALITRGGPHPVARYVF